MDKQQITNHIAQDKNMQAILNIYKNNQFTKGNKIDFTNEYKNGFTNSIYTIELNDMLNTVIVPLFSTEKTITWNFNYIKNIKAVLPDYTDEQLIEMIKCPLYYYDKISDEIIFLQLISLKDYLKFGINGKNGFSVYFWNDKLPNQYAIKKKDIVSQLFVDTLPLYNKTELMTLCKEYATKYYKLFANVSNRSDQTKINNIANGLYAQIIVYLDLLKQGYDVSMDWYTEDDLGIDIQFHINNEIINIDVKSTKTKDLKISKNRKETDFYAICTWNGKVPVLQGYLFKYYFWDSKLLNTQKPNKKDEMYFKSLTELNDLTVNIDEVFNIKHKYKILKMKRGETLFQID